MPRIRTLKPEHRQHRKVGALTHRQYRLWVGMICEADDEGRLVATAASLRVLIFGYHPDVTEADIDHDLSQLVTIRLIRVYVVRRTRYAVFPNWQYHQHIDRPKKSKLPPPGVRDTSPTRRDPSSIRRRPIDDTSSMNRVGSRIKDQGSSPRSTTDPRYSPPPVDTGGHPDAPVPHALTAESAAPVPDSEIAHAIDSDSESNETPADRALLEVAAKAYGITIEDARRHQRMARQKETTPEGGTIAP